jgi:microcin C transport system permease protein
MLFISYFISIPLGIRKAVRDGTPFDVWTSGALVIGYALPGFMVGVFLLVFFAGGSFYQIFPIGKLTSDGAENLGWFAYLADVAWHITLPLFAMVLSAFTTLTFLTKNSFIDEIRKQYVLTARSKGLTEGQVLYGHIFRNAMLIVIAGFPSAFVSAFFTGSFLIEVIFSLDGLGLLGYESVINRDYPVVFATLYIFTLLGLVMHLVTDFIYTLVDPRIDFESREV